MVGIYKITNLTNNKSYIGQSNNIKKRFRSHINDSSNIKSQKYNYPLPSAIRKYGVENFSFEILEICEEEELYDKELFYYKKYKPEYCISIPNESISLSKEARKKISMALKGRKLSKDHIEKMKGLHLGIKSPLSKLTIATSMDGSLFYFESLGCAAKVFIELSISSGTYNSTKTSIWRAVSGRRKTAYGFEWKQTEQNKDFFINKDYSELVKKSINIKNAVGQYDPFTDELIAIYPSAREAGRALGNVNKNKHISSVINGHRKSAYGYKWKRIN